MFEGFSDPYYYDLGRMDNNMSMSISGNCIIRQGDIRFPIGLGIVFLDF